MKKILLLLLFGFSVIAYAAPPPDPAPVMFADQVQYVIQDEVQTINTTAQEVAYVYTGDWELQTYQVITIEQEAKLEFPDLVMNDELLAYNGELNRPPANIDLMVLEIDKQHSNYGYPLTAN